MNTERKKLSLDDFLELRFPTRDIDIKERIRPEDLHYPPKPIPMKDKEGHYVQDPDKMAAVPLYRF
jgi:hypothetical protein